MPTNSATKRLCGRRYTSCGGPACWISPRYMTMIRSAVASASDWLCVTYTNVIPSSCCNSRSSLCIRTRKCASSDPSGSSRSSTFGSMTSARASPTRCFWPPESWAIDRPASSPIPTFSSARLTRSLRSSFSTLRILSPNSTFFVTLRNGNSAKFCHTRGVSRSHGFMSFVSCPSIRINPLVGVSSPAISRNVVVLPQPLGPMKATNSP